MTLSPNPSVAPNPRYRTGKGRRFVPDVAERVRVLVEGTGLTHKEIAARVGVGATTVYRLAQQHGWRRPAEAQRWKVLAAADRSGLGPELGIAWGRLAAMARAIERAAAAEIAVLAAGEARSRALAEASERAAQLFGRAGGGAGLEPSRERRARGPDGLVRLSALPAGDRRRTRGPDTLAAARRLVEGTTLTQGEIAALLGIAVPTLSRWVQDNAWVRPADAPSRIGGGGQARTRRWAARAEAEAASRRGLAEVERALGALEAETEAGAGGDREGRLARLEAAAAGLGEALRAGRVRRAAGPSVAAYLAGRG